MDLLINKYLTNQASASECRDLELWISSSTQNKAYFVFQKRMWDSARMSKNEPKINVEDALTKFKQKHQIETKDLKLAGEVKRMRVKPLVFVRLAAACLVLLIGTYFTYNFIQEKSTVVFNNTIIASIDNQEVKLQDGTSVWLRKNARLNYPQSFSTKTRNVEIQGEAFFDVAKDKNKPFLVKMSNSLIEVLGTKFNVKSDSNGKDEIIVEEGHVRFSAQDSKKELFASDKLVYNVKESLIETSHVKNLNALAWRNKSLVFDDVKLDAVIEDIGNAYNSTITLEKPCLGAKSFSSTLDLQSKSIDEVLMVISSALNLNVKTLTKDSFHIFGECK